MKGMDPVPTVDGLKEEMADGYSRAVASRSRRAVLTCTISGCAGAEPPKHSRAACVGDRGHRGARGLWHQRQRGALKRAWDENEELIGRCLLGGSSSERGTAGRQTQSCSSRRVTSEWWGAASQTGCPPAVGVKPQKR